MKDNTRSEDSNEKHEVIENIANEIIHKATEEIIENAYHDVFDGSDECNKEQPKQKSYGHA